MSDEAKQLSEATENPISENDNQRMSTLTGKESSSQEDELRESENIKLVKKKRSVIDADYQHALEEEEEELASSLESSSSVGSYVMQKDIEVMPDFFDMLGDIPDLDDISEDLDMPPRITIVSVAESDHHIADTGKFVDPLTGEVLESTESTEAVEPVEEEAAEEDDDEIGEDDELLALLPQVEEETDADKRLPEEEVLDTFFEMETVKEVVIVEDIDFEALEREEAKRQLIANTTDFLNDVIDRVVDKCEYVDPNTILRQNLDKKMLVYQLKGELADLEIEQKACYFLNRKVVEFFRRKKSYRPLLDDNPETVADDIQKFKESTTKLDQLLGRMQETRTTSDKKMRELSHIATDMGKQQKANIGELEDLIRRTFTRESFDKLKVTVDAQLSKMNEMREELSEVRFVLIQRQHSLASLKAKIEELEYLGNGLQMKNFEHLTTETQALGKKIEERNAELNKLRIRCNGELHIMAHMREKQKMLREHIIIQESNLKELQHEKRLVRERVYHLKIDRGIIRREIRELSFQGGLIDKPALMFDHDETVERVTKLRSKIDQMRSKLTETHNRIQAVQDKCLNADMIAV